MSTAMEKAIRENLSSLPSEKEFVIGEVKPIKSDKAILDLMHEGYSYLEATEKLESARRAKVQEQFEKEIDALEQEDNDYKGYDRDNIGDYDW